MNIDRNGRAHPPLPLARGPEDAPPVPNPEGAIAGALSRPLGAPALDRFVEPGDRVVVLQDAALPPALRALAAAPIAAALEAAAAADVNWLVVEAAPPAAEARRLEGEAGATEAGIVAGEVTPRDPGSEFVAVGRAPCVGVVRLLAEVARADKLVLMGRCAWHPRLGLAGAGSLVSHGSADPSTRAAILGVAAEPEAIAGAPPSSPRTGAASRPGRPCEGEASEAVLLLAPPAFALLLGVQSNARIAGVFAGDALAVSDACARSLRRR